MNVRTQCIGAFQFSQMYFPCVDLIDGKREANNDSRKKVTRNNFCRMLNSAKSHKYSFTPFIS